MIVLRFATEMEWRSGRIVAVRRPQAFHPEKCM
jgi:hypothetical protein